MFKKLKDKLAEEVKSSPQRIQQFAQAAQAAVTSASSSISDITNTDLFSIGDNDTQQNRSVKEDISQNNPTNTFQDVSLMQPTNLPSELVDYKPIHDMMENQRQRRLSNSSFASDVSFRLPSYESPSMYHLQSDMEISASEAEERGFSSGSVSLDRVTKEQIYAAYKRTQERYTKYRTQYADLARHYKLLERENAKAKSVLVETQDKALRRISELREQCALEQSAKAHLEKALRGDIEERNIKIETLNTKIQLLQGDVQNNSNSKPENINKSNDENEVQLITLTDDNDNKSITSDDVSAEIVVLNNRIEKMEQLLIKYKDSLKVTKEKNNQLATEIKILSDEFENKCKENEHFQLIAVELNDAKEKIQELNDVNETLQNKINSYDFSKTKETSTLEIELQRAQEEIEQLRSKIELFMKREEEYAISLAENKLSIHKELDTKESEIKSLKETVANNAKEIQSLKIVIGDYKNTISLLEEERAKLNINSNELNVYKNKITQYELQSQELTQKNQSLESSKAKIDEEFKCLQLQLKQETAEKLAMRDRNSYLENRCTQLSEEITRKGSQLSNLEKELQVLKKDKDNKVIFDETEKNKMLDEIDVWKMKYTSLESEMQEEREELVKLQSEIEKLLINHELIQIKNQELNEKLNVQETENTILGGKLLQLNDISIKCENMLKNVNELRYIVTLTSEEANSFVQNNNNMICALKENISNLLNTTVDNIMKSNYNKDLSVLRKELQDVTKSFDLLSTELNTLQVENNHLKSAVQAKDEENTKIKEKLQNMYTQHEIIIKDLDSINTEKQKILNDVTEYKNKCQELQDALKKDNDLRSSVNQKSIKLEKENDDFNNKLKKMEDNNTLQKEEIRKLHSEINEQLVKYKTLEKENEDFSVQIKSIENNKNILNEEIRKLHSEINEQLFKYKALEKENKELSEQIKSIENNKNICINKMESEIKSLIQENILLKSQTETISNSVRDLETEICEVRKSHNDIEIEKDRLSSIIEKLESNQKEHRLTIAQAVQTEGCDPLLQKRDTELLEIFNSNEDNSREESLIESTRNTLLQEKHIILQNKDDESKQIINELAVKYDSLKEEYNLQKEENRRLNSDIAGLQTHLTKISKENSVLNDKLRELIASSENSDKTELLSRDLVHLKNEIQSGKEKIDDLMRENNLLIDENFELKDQLNSQNYKPLDILNNGSKTEIITLKEKNSNLLDTNLKLERKVSDLEQMNNSVNYNIAEVQANNEKLRLSNEKLERRLDEALVSLRHLHSLQENTELEYLRNILFEYLTGTGTHSVTLAKVLAAVVKFDDKQTQQILQKEKERQGLLRQLGLL